MESLVSLMNPLKWNFVFITYLTPKLVECLEAPFPFMIGVSRKVWDNYCVMREYPDDIIILDIDNQKLLNQVREELPPLPQPQASVLQRSLKGLLDIKERFVETIQENSTQRIPKDKIDEYYWAYAQLRVKQSFFNFFLLTINNYIGYFKNLDEEGDLSPNKKDKQFYDKLSSVDVFDFDNYLNQFEGGNKDFMQKLIHTQSFNNFIEDTYRNVSPKTPIGFFKTNFEVMLEHSFKRLKKEQNKLLDKTFFNLQNVRQSIHIYFQQPVKFNIGHMFKQYKKQLLMKHGMKLKKLMEDEGDFDNQDDNQLDFFSRQDLLEKLLLQEVESNSDKQLSLLNNVNYDLVTDMPGIQYEQITLYEQLKSQRSDQSQDRKAQNKTTMHGQKHSSSQGFEFQQRTINNQKEKSDQKSRNTKVIQSRSNENHNNEQKHIQFGMHKRAGAGIIYNNFLSMADSKNAMFLSQDDQQNNMPSGQIGNLFIQAPNNIAQDFDMRHFKRGETVKAMIPHNHNSSINDICNNSSAPIKQRVNSENSYVKNFGSFSLNKTVIVNSNQHLQKSTTQIQNNLKSKQKNMKSNDFSNNMNNTLDKPQIINQTLESQSPKIIQPQRIQTGAKLNDSCIIQQNVLKETLNRKIAQERSKHGLQLKSNDNRQVNNYQNQPSANLSHLSMTQDEPNLKIPQKYSQLQTNITKKSIDLMNPKNKKISRNEERKLAHKRGFLGFENHDSFYQFYSPNEELNKLAIMQMIQRKMENKKILQNKNGKPQNEETKEQASFSQYIYQNYNSNGSDDDQLTRLFQQQFQNTQNKIQFQKRPGGQSPSYIMMQQLNNDPFATTINFQSNFIQQKPQLNQSPSVTQTEMSSIRKGETIDENHEQDDGFVIVQEQPQVNNIQRKIQSPGHQVISKIAHKLQHQVSPIQGVKKSHGKIEARNKFDNKKTNIAQRQKPDNNLAQNKSLNLVTTLNEEDLEHVNETRPLKVVDEMMNNTATHQTTTKHRKLIDQESPPITKNLKQQNLSFKFFINNMKDKKKIEETKNEIQNSNSKSMKQVSQANRSPKNSQIAKLQKQTNLNKHQSKINQMQTFDNTTTRNDQTKPEITNLQRKRSSPAFTQEKSPSQKTSSKFQIGGQKGTHEQKSNSQNSSQYFKQRPATTNNQSKSNNNSSNVTKTLQIDLGNREKLSGMTKVNSRQGFGKDIQSLRISPIPNIDEILKAKQNSIASDTAHLLNESHNNMINYESNNRSSNTLQINSGSAQANSSNFNSRQSNKSVNGGGQDIQINYQTLSQQAEVEIFEKSNQQLYASQTSRHKNQHHQNKKAHKHQCTKSKTSNVSNNMFPPSLRLSTNLQQSQNRSSQLSARINQRSSQLSLMAKNDKDPDEDLPMMGSSKSKSDVLSYNDGINNISILKSSPRLMNQTSSKFGNSSNVNIKQPQASNNFMFSGPAQMKLQNSHDTAQMASLMSAIKSQVPHTATNNSSIVNTVKIDLNSKKMQSPSNGFQTGSKSKIVITQHSQQKTLMRTSSIDDAKKEVSMSSESKVFTNRSHDKKSNIHNIQKNQQKHTLKSTNIMSTNLYLKTLQSEEFQLKEKGKKKFEKTFTSSLDPVVSLQKEQAYSSNGTGNQYQVNQSKTTKNLQLELKEPKSQSSLFKSQSQIEQQSQVSKSTKNLYGTLNKERLLDEINDVNDTLNKVQASRKMAQKSGLNILEETLSHKSNSIQPSPRLSKINSGQQTQKEAQQKLQNALMQAEQQEDKNENQLTTIRMNPQQNFNLYKSKTLEKIAENKDKKVIIDFPRQISQEDHLQMKERQSKIIDEIDQLMTVKPQKSYNTHKHNDSKESLNKFISRERSGRSYLEPSGHPLIELRQNSNNRVSQIPNGKGKQSRSSPPSKKESQYQSNKLMSQGSKFNLKSENSYKLFQYQSSRHSHAAAVTSNKMPQEFGSIVVKQKKRQLRHGLTSCYQGQSKDSNNYVRRDLNQDAFCQINCHQGDVDNDPHTPQSNGSMRSQEKNNQRKAKRQRVISEYQYINENSPQHNDLIMADNLHNQEEKYTPLRIHSSSVDNRIDIPQFNRPTIGAPQQTLRRQEIYEAEFDEDQKFQQHCDENQDDDFLYEDEEEDHVPNDIYKSVQNPQQTLVKYEVLFDDADLKDTDDKFTSRDVNFNRLRNTLQ